MNKSSRKDNIGKHATDMKCEEDPGNMGAMLAGQLSKEEARGSLGRWSIKIEPVLRDHFITTDDNVFFLSIHPYAPPATRAAHPTLSCHRGTHCHWFQSQGIGTLWILRLSLCMLWLALSTWEYMGKPSFSRAWIWAQMT